MRDVNSLKVPLRRVLSHGIVGLVLAIIGLSGVSAAQASEGKIKVGLMLPYTGTYASLGNAITNGFTLYVAEQGGKLGGREVEYFVVDDESDPAKATENANKLVKRDKVDVLDGTVLSGVALAALRRRAADAHHRPYPDDQPGPAHPR